MSKLGKIDRIKLSGFKSIKNMDLELRNINILIGQNGAGKSNFINFFKFMNALQSKDLQHYVATKGTSEAFLHFGRKKTSSILGNIEFKENAYSVKLEPTQDGKFIFIGELAGKRIENFNRSYDTVLSTKSGEKESCLPDNLEAVGIEGDVARYLAECKGDHFHDTSDTAKVKDTHNINDNDKLRPQGENLAAFLYYLSIRKTSEYQKIVQTIQRVAPFFQDFILQPDKLNPDMIRLRWKHRGSDAYFDANDLSDGTLRFICLATLLLQPDLPAIIILDEPDLGLHPFALQLLAAMIRSASAKTQIIAATQSVTLANQFSYEDILVVERKNEESIFRRLQEEEIKIWIDDYSIGDLWERNFIGGTPEC